MENKDELLKKISSNDPALTAEAFRELKEKGDESVLVPLLDLLDDQQDMSVVSDIIELLASVKENSFREILMNRIRQTTEIQQKSNLIRIAWESSLDYSANWKLFVESLLNDDFIVALEAATLIECFVHNLNEDEQKQLRALLESATFSADKKCLIQGIIEEMENPEDWGE